MTGSETQRRSLFSRQPANLYQRPVSRHGSHHHRQVCRGNRSPLTGFIADSLSSSYFAIELKRTGVDGLVITGQAASLAYIHIRNEIVEIRDAAYLMGKTASETESLIRTELSSAATRVAAIGKAGENRVRFATISNEGRHAGRGGVVGRNVVD